MMPIISAGYSCREIVEGGAASAFLNGELTWSEWARLRVHLLTCPPCARFVEELGMTVEVLRDLKSTEGRDMRAELMNVFDDWSSGRLPDEPDAE